MKYALPGLLRIPAHGSVVSTMYDKGFGSSFLGAVCEVRCSFCETVSWPGLTEREPELHRCVCGAKAYHDSDEVVRALKAWGKYVDVLWMKSV